MKKYMLALAILICFILTGCEEEYTGIIKSVEHKGYPSAIGAPHMYSFVEFEDGTKTIYDYNYYRVLKVGERVRYDYRKGKKTKTSRR